VRPRALAAALQARALTRSARAAAVRVAVVNSLVQASSDQTRDGRRPRRSSPQVRVGRGVREEVGSPHAPSLVELLHGGASQKEPTRATRVDAERVKAADRAALEREGRVAVDRPQRSR
jgi:hypothetical protein